MIETNDVKKGIILAFTTLHVTAAGFEPPLGIALVELNPGERLMCNSDDNKVFEIGDSVILKMIGDRWVIIS